MFIFIKMCMMNFRWIYETTKFFLLEPFTRGLCAENETSLFKYM